MKSLFNYHVVTLSPILIILYFYSFEIMSTLWFLIAMFTYAFVFRPVIDFIRLKELGILGNDDFWKIFGFIRFRHYSTLMFGK